jgi:hypothetical protein
MPVMVESKHSQRPGSHRGAPTGDGPGSTLPDRMNQAAVSTYLADLTGELAAVARDHNLHTLAFLLDMARLEAENISQDRGQG